jgi:hypothetical protein
VIAKQSIKFIEQSSSDFRRQKSEIAIFKPKELSSDASMQKLAAIRGHNLDIPKVIHATPSTLPL